MLGIIGIILLVLFLLIFSLVLLVLFYPIVYRVKGDFGNEHNNLYAKVTWLFGMFKITIDIEQDTKVYANFLFFRKRLYTSNDTEDLVDSEYENKNNDKINLPNEKVHESQKDRTKKGSIEIITKIEENEEDTIQENEEEKIEYKAKISIKNIKSFIAGLKDKFSNISEKYEYITKDSHNRAAVFHLKEEIYYVLKKIMPKKLKLYLNFSAASPDKTGIVLGLFAMFPIGYKNSWNIEPDFESDEFFIKGNTDIKGYLFLYQFLAVVLRIVFDKNCRKLYNNLKN